MSPVSWLSTVNQIVMAGESPILADLDAVLELTARSTGPDRLS
jgi:dTDP-4-amino-4,6-dideoxygalactose transaminase